MAEVKKRFRALSDWLTYELETDALEPPILKVRVKPIYGIDAVDYAVEGEKMKLSTFIFNSVIEAVQEWDLTENGTPIPVTYENKLACLGRRLSDRIKDSRILLGMEIFIFAADQENFLKN